MNGTCAFLTMAELGDFVTDDELAIEPFARRGWKIEFVPWRDSTVDWNRFDAVVVRSPWDYQTYPAEFLQTLADLWKSRWQIERFFKWIKQHLRIKSLYGTSQNAVMAQV